MTHLPVGKFDIIYTDPPWPREKGGIRKSRPNQKRSLDYKTMSLDDIFKLHHAVMESNCNNPHAVFMWAIDKFLIETCDTMNRLGYKLHARIIWNKLNGVAPAFTVRYTHEYLLWFYYPKMIPIDKSQRGKWTTVLEEKSTSHSRKPEIAYTFIESVYPLKSKLEMYARNTRNGWESWGDELDLADSV